MRGELDAAAESFHRALDIDPDYVEARGQLPDPPTSGTVSMTRVPVVKWCNIVRAFPRALPAEIMREVRASAAVC